MIVVGLVGKIAAGKSTVARRLAARGAHVIDADAVAHDALDDPEAKRAIVARFGGDVLDEAGRVRRPALAGRVFGPTPAHAAALADLEAIVHPLVRRRPHPFSHSAHVPPECTVTSSGTSCRGSRDRVVRMKLDSARTMRSARPAAPSSISPAMA